MLALAALKLHRWEKAVPSEQQKKISSLLSFSFSSALQCPSDCAIHILKSALLSPLNFSIFGILDIFKMLICSINVNYTNISHLYIISVEPPNYYRIY